jgi:hypothetical protein
VVIPATNTVDLKAKWEHNVDFEEEQDKKAGMRGGNK